MIFALGGSVAIIALQALIVWRVHRLHIKPRNDLGDDWVEILEQRKREGHDDVFS